MFIPLHAHPLFYGVIGMMVGIVSTAYCTPFYLLTILASCLFILLVRRVPQLIVICCIGILFGCIRLSITKYCHMKAVKEITDYTHQLPATCKAKVIDCSYKDGIYHRYQLTVRLYTINDHTLGWARLYTVVLNAPRDFKCAISDHILLTNLKVSCSKENTHTSWLLKNGCIARCYQNSFILSLIERPFISFQRFIFEQRARLWLRIKKSTPLKTYTLLASLFGGSKEVSKECMQHYKILFKRWGIAHQLARSGMHVSFFISLWMLLLCYMPLGLVVRSWCIIVLIVLYALFSWPSISFNRALIMAIIDQLLRIMGKQKNSLHVWSLTTALVVLYNPVYIFFIDFQLSFGFSLLLIWMAQLNYLEKRGF